MTIPKRVGESLSLGAGLVKSCFQEGTVMAPALRSLLTSHQSGTCSLVLVLVSTTFVHDCKLVAFPTTQSVSSCLDRPILAQHPPSHPTTKCGAKRTILGTLQHIQSTASSVIKQEVQKSCHRSRDRTIRGVGPIQEFPQISPQKAENGNLSRKTMFLQNYP